MSTPVYFPELRNCCLFHYSKSLNFTEHAFGIIDCYLFRQLKLTVDFINVNLSDPVSTLFVIKTDAVIFIKFKSPALVTVNSNFQRMPIRIFCAVVGTKW